MSHSVRTLVDSFLAWIETRNRPRTVAYYRSFLERFAAAVGDLPVAELRRHHLLSWGRTWHELQSVQRLFNWAHVEMELIDRNPFATIKRPRPGRRRRVLDRKEVIRILRGGERNFRGFLLAMIETIARPQEVRSFRWSQLRWDRGTLTHEQALREGEAHFELWEYKARDRRADPHEPRRVFISRRLGRFLCRLALRAPAGVDFIFLNSRGEPWTANAVRLRVRRLRSSCGLDADGRGEKVVAYSLRHTSATNASAAGVPDRVLAEMMGHTTTRTTARYQHIGVEHIRRALCSWTVTRRRKKPSA